jgi:hypothetical protein
MHAATAATAYCIQIGENAFWCVRTGETSLDRPRALRKKRTSLIDVAQSVFHVVGSIHYR